MKEIQNYVARENPKRNQEREEIERLRNLAADSQQDITKVSQRVTFL